MLYIKENQNFIEASILNINRFEYFHELILNNSTSFSTIDNKTYVSENTMNNVNFTYTADAVALYVNNSNATYTFDNKTIATAEQIEKELIHLLAQVDTSNFFATDIHETDGEEMTHVLYKSNFVQ